MDMIYWYSKLFLHICTLDILFYSAKAVLFIILILYIVMTSIDVFCIGYTQDHTRDIFFYLFYHYIYDALNILIISRKFQVKSGVFNLF